MQASGSVQPGMSPPVQVFTVSYGDETHPDDGYWPALRIADGELDVGIRVLRADSLCTRCFGTGGDGGTGCGFVDEMGGACDHGWLSRGRAKLHLGVPTSSDRRIRPADARLHAWFDG